MFTVEEQRTMQAIQSINQKMPDMDLRDIFAMNVINGICASYTTGCPFERQEGIERISRWAYEVADEMLLARRRKNG